MMDHSYIVQHEIIEKYLLQQLTDAEESKFEEHLLYCQVCRDELEKMKKTLAAGKAGLFDPDSIAAKKKKQFEIRPYRTILKYAAVAIVLIGLSSIILYHISKERPDGTISAKNHIADSIHSDSSALIKDKKTKEKIADGQNHKREKKGKHTIKEEMYAEAYIPSPFFEEMVKVHYRANTIEIISPSLNDSVTTGAEILFYWKSEQYDSLNLIVFSNREQIVIEKKIGNKYIYTKTSHPGLYYWQLEDSEEALYVSKFFILPK